MTRISSLTFIYAGISDEMANVNMQTILRCLQQVDNSRPYFVGLLGERYGWHQERDGNDAALSKSFDVASIEYP